MSASDDSAMPIDVVIPARNEAATVGDVVRAAVSAGVREVIVADNGSTDATAEIAREAGARVVAAPREGYGSACLAALATIAVGPSVVVFMVADGSDDARDLTRVAGPVARGEADVVIGSRLLGDVEPGAMTRFQRLGSAFAARVLTVRFGQRVTDLGPFRAIRRDALERLAMRDRTWGWTMEMQVKAARAGLRTIEVPVAWRNRRGGQSKVTGTVRGTLGASRKILAWMTAAVLGPGHDPVGR